MEKRGAITDDVTVYEDGSESEVEPPDPLPELSCVTIDSSRRFHGKSSAGPGGYGCSSWVLLSPCLSLHEPFVVQESKSSVK